MKFLKNAVSMLLAAVTAVTMMFTGSVTAGANSDDDFVKMMGSYDADGNYYINVFGSLTVLFGTLIDEYHPTNIAYMASLSFDDMRMEVSLERTTLETGAYAFCGYPYVNFGDDDVFRYDQEAASSCYLGFSEISGKQVGVVVICLPKGSKIIDRLSSVKKVTMVEGIYKVEENTYTGVRNCSWEEVPYRFDGLEKTDKDVSLKKTTLTAKRSGNKIKLSWKKVDGAEKYQIYYREKGESKYKRLVTVSGSKTSYSTSKLDKSKTYQFKIRSYAESNGEKIYSKFSKVKTVASK